jgi:endonuclease YncB( thermonuclease family)
MTRKGWVWLAVIWASIGFWVAVVLLTVVAVRATAAPMGYVVDGDTIRLRDGQYVRFIGYDTKELDTACGVRAQKALIRMAGFPDIRLTNPTEVVDQDRYGRLLRYGFNRNGRDIGAALIRKGLADARYDSRDGYQWHRKEAKYHRLDATHPDVC